jgi:hypothetical protein
MSTNESDVLSPEPWFVAKDLSAKVNISVQPTHLPRHA